MQKNVREWSEQKDLRKAFPCPQLQTLLSFFLILEFFFFFLITMASTKKLAYAVGSPKERRILAN